MSEKHMHMMGTRIEREDGSLLAILSDSPESVLARLDDYARLSESHERLREALLVMLDHVDYMAHACSPTEMVGALYITRERLKWRHGLCR